ncbi:MAG TPA: hypothetical protein VF589_04005 [Allosphingosinicella sp.]|jgi:heme A synthase
MRPKSIILFERVVAASLVLGLLGIFLYWENSAAAIRQVGLGTGFLAGVMLITFGLYFLLLWLIARRRSRVAAWIYIVLTGLSLVTGLIGIPAMLQGQPLHIALTVVQYGLNFLSVLLLFRRDSRDWLAGKDNPQYDRVFD